MSQSQKNSRLSLSKSRQSGRSAFVPAAPGWYAIEPVYDGYVCDGVPLCELMKVPVIAWQIEMITARDGSTFTSTSPITIELERDPEALEAPDGHFHVFEVDDFATAAELIAYFSKREAKRRKAEEARNAERTGAEAGAR